MKTIKIIIAEPNRLFREGIQLMLSNELGMDCIGETENIISLLNILQENTPDVLIIGINCSELDIINNLGQIRNEYPLTEIIILSVNKDPHFIYKCIAGGICAYLPNEVSKEEFILTIRKAAVGQKCFNFEIELLLQEGLAKKRKLGEIKLSKRQMDVIGFLANGYSTKQISEKLILSSRTIESHRLRLLHRFEAQNSMELIKMARERLLIK